MFRVYDGRIRRMLDEDGPHYLNWDQDQTAIDDDYASQDPAAVSEELVIDGAKLANLFDSIEVEQWERTGFRSDGAAFTVDTHLALLPARHRPSPGRRARLAM